MACAGSDTELSDIRRTDWDAVVIGAGLAGSMAARGLAQRGLRTLIVERSAFPRPKLCGGCLSDLGLRTLGDAGLGHMLHERRATPLDRIRFVSAGRVIETASPEMRVIDREPFDAALLASATNAGATSLIGWSARIEDSGTVSLRRADDRAMIQPRAIVDAAGLRGASGDPNADTRRARSAPVGLGAIAERDRADLPHGVLMMGIARSGYLGVVRLADGRLNCAAAVWPSAIRRAGSPAAAVREIAAVSGLGAELPPATGWSGAPVLTIARPAQRGRVFRVGDAAGFVEPITGEGMSWALAAGAAVAPHVEAFVGGRRITPAWPAAHRRLLASRRRRCALVAAAMRRPRLAHAGLRTISVAPGLRDRAVRALAGGAVAPAA